MADTGSVEQLQRVLMPEEALVSAWEVSEGTVPKGSEEWYSENLHAMVQEILARRPNLRGGSRG